MGGKKVKVIYQLCIGILNQHLIYQISAVLIKSLDNPFNLLHNDTEQEQKTKDNEHEKNNYLYLFNRRRIGGNSRRVII